MAKRRKGKERLPVIDRYTNRKWKNVHSESGLTSLTAFAKAQGSGYNLRELERSLSRITAFSMHRPVRKNYPRPAIIINDVGVTICFDLIQLTSLKKFNGNYAWILLVMDQFSKRVSLHPLKTKRASEVAVAMKKAIKELSLNGRYKFKNGNSDEGGEFKGEVAQLLKRHRITHYINRGPHHSSICERSVRRIKTVMFRWLTLNNTKNWVSILSQIQNKINFTKSDAHGFRPVDITPSNSHIAFQRLYHRLIAKPKKPPKLKVGDEVRVSGARKIFGKAYHPGYGKKVYKIKAVRESLPVDSYILEDGETGQQLDTTFVESELSLAFSDLSLKDGTARNSAGQ